VATSLKDAFTDLIAGRETAEATFAAPWEARAFAIVLELAQGGRITLDEFRQHLIAEIGTADDVTRAGGQGRSYYESWLAALEHILRERNLAGSAEVNRSAEIIAANPPAPTVAISRGPIRIA
jgi:nitrile hydratase accessory protein